MHGEDAVSQGLVECITLPTLGAFRDFTKEAIADVMYYLTPKQVAESGVLPFSAEFYFKWLFALSPGQAAAVVAVVSVVLVLVWCRRLWVLLSMLMLSAPRLYSPPLVQYAGGNFGGGGEEDERDVEGVRSLEPGLPRQGG